LHCGASYLISPVKTTIHGYTPVSIVTNDQLVSFTDHQGSIILDNATENGTFDVLLEVKSTQKYTIPNDNSEYESIQLYFYVRVVISKVGCIPNFTLTS
jgi:hypothetical protein